MDDLGQPLPKEERSLAGLNYGWMLSKPDTRDFKSQEKVNITYLILTVEKYCSEDYICH